ncbi:MAG: hypothetical protein AAF378_23845 [Cyanobacteria bacterium P01_A01_bin.84]
MHWLDSGVALMHFLATTAQNTVQSPPDLTAPHNSSVDIKLLTEQINFLKDANSQLHTSFDSYADAIRTTIIFTGSLLTLIALATGILINQNYRTTVKELKEDTKDRIKVIQANLESELSLATDKKIDRLRKIIRQEEVISDADVVYINTQTINPIEFEILRQRGFERIEFKQNIEQRQLSNKIVILDLINLGLNQNEEKEAANQIIKNTIDKIEKRFPTESLLIIYAIPGRPRITQLLAANSIKYVTVANNRITLVGAVVDSASILDTVLA